MDKKNLIQKLETLNREYKDYLDYYNKFEEEIFKEGKQGLAQKVKDKDFEKELEDFYFKKLVLKVTYEGDINLMYNKLVTLVEAANIMEIEIPEDVKITLKNSADRKFKTRLFMRQDTEKPEEIEAGYLDNLRDDLKENFQLDKIIENIKKQ